MTETLPLRLGRIRMGKRVGGGHPKSLKLPLKFWHLTELVSR